MSMIARGMRMHASRPLASVIGRRSLDLVPRAAIYTEMVLCAWDTGWRFRIRTDSAEGRIWVVHVDSWASAHADLTELSQNC
jgi:hypothetical protein